MAIVQLIQSKHAMWCEKHAEGVPAHAEAGAAGYQLPPGSGHPWQRLLLLHGQAPAAAHSLGCIGVHLGICSRQPERGACRGARCRDGRRSADAGHTLVPAHRRTAHSKVSPEHDPQLCNAFLTLCQVMHAPYSREALSLGRRHAQPCCTRCSPLHMQALSKGMHEKKIGPSACR